MSRPRELLADAFFEIDGHGDQFGVAVWNTDGGLIRRFRSHHAESPFYHLTWPPDFPLIGTLVNGAEQRLPRNVFRVDRVPPGSALERIAERDCPIRLFPDGDFRGRPIPLCWAVVCPDSRTPGGTPSSDARAERASRLSRLAAQAAHLMGVSGGEFGWWMHVREHAPDGVLLVDAEAREDRTAAVMRGVAAASMLVLFPRACDERAPVAAPSPRSDEPTSVIYAAPAAEAGHLQGEQQDEPKPSLRGDSLYFGGVLIRTFTARAKRQLPLLRRLHDQGWPCDGVEVPEGPVPPSKAANDFNKALPPAPFVLRASGNHLTWVRRPAETPD